MELNYLWGDSIKYLLLGYGISNQSLKKYFDAEKIEYILYDDFVSDYRVNVDINSFDIMVKSPIVKNDHWLIKIAQKMNKKIITDLELFYLLSLNKELITVTGTNGKTTTVNLINNIIKTIDIGGNLGIPLFNLIDSPKDIVIEASSFMLEYTDMYHSKYNVLLNLSPNHLDHHDNYYDYIRCKLKMLSNITEDDYLIYNYDDILIRRLVSHLDVKKIPFSIEQIVDGGYIINNTIYYKENKILNVENINLLGRHNIANIIASVCLSLNYNPELKMIEDSVRRFQPIEHRIEYIGKINDVKVYNDSKSTNFKALKTALDSFVNEKILLICGGKTSIDNLDILNEATDNIHCVLTNGENRIQLNDFFRSKNIYYESYENLDYLLENLSKHLQDISVILFSPGSVSYDQFKNFEERGIYFKQKIVSR